MKYHQFDIRSGKRHFIWNVQGENEADARLELWTRMSGLDLDVDEIKLVKTYEEVQDGEAKTT